ncbi:MULTISPECIES: flagellar export chaperone FliS [Paenibacillus]|uniref:flagellar export chaperone FliS n=1 Tax=Paenibacillus TaxID=44249 RepID=UPI00096CD325|nr:flagellar export chaperone FliS [Paenibacillus odorifer]OME56489.1 flagellar export chaperone FliS [Paenibacillus odorifer]OME61878.1 flagellar export chaperone FliS [Paenibacillus odorifer]
MINQAYQKYQQTQLQTASPAQLLLMLYDGAIRFIRVGISGIEEKDVQKTNTYLGKAQGVIHELIAALNFDYEISNTLHSVYEYMIHQLIKANINKEKATATEVLNYLIDLREAWDTANKSLSNSKVGLV